MATVRFGWETFETRRWFFAGIAVITTVASMFASGIGGAFGQYGAASIIGNAVSFFLSAFISLGMTAFFLAAHDAPERVDSRALWHPQQFLSYAVVQVVTGLAILLGLILLIVPGIILGLMFMFAPYLVVDRGLGPLEAIGESRRITTGHKWELLKLSLLLVLVNLLGFICLIVGLFVSIPVTMFAIVHAYRTLSAQAAASAPAHV